ncbi:MAG: hypothetical protein SGJ05_06125 [bacterium]|nr:hypothetical protein [bacterium]
MKLHIANGDAQLPELQSLGLEGRIIPWREALVDGPVRGALATEDFWSTRKTFVEGAYGASPASYEKDIIEEFMKIIHIGSWNDIVLWFDRDLFCVVNATFLIYHLRASHAMGTHITWMLDGQPLELTRDDLAYAAQMWRAYAGPEPRELERLINKEPAGALGFVRDAYALHLHRFPSVDTGRSLVEETLLSSDDPQPLTQFLREHNEGYGFGDVQLERIMNRLQPESGSPVVLGGYSPTSDTDLRWDASAKRLVAV